MTFGNRGEAAPFFFTVAADLAPYYLSYYELNGKFTWVREKSAAKSVPDIVFRYNGHDILALDYKGPNCIFEKEIRACCAKSVSEALKTMPPPRASSSKGSSSKGSSSKGSSSKGKGKGKAVSYSADDHPSLVSAVDQRTQALLKQGIKYSQTWGVSTVLFYDYDYLLAIQPPPQLASGNNLTLMDVTICHEHTKSVESNLVVHPDNHAVVLLRYIIATASACAEQEARLAGAHHGR